MATVLSLALSAVIGLLAFRRSDVREHHRWLQEKRREAYVKFFSTTQDAYGRISSPERAGRPNQDKEAIDRDESNVWYAQNVLDIVGPKKMADEGRKVIARLKLDRLYYSPSRIRL